MTSKTIAERDRCIAEALPLRDSPGAGVGRRAAGLPAREDGALGNGSGAGLGANVPEPSLDVLFRAPNHQLGEEGTSFAEILDQLRAALAKRYLHDETLPVSESR